MNDPFSSPPPPEPPPLPDRTARATDPGRETHPAAPPHPQPSWAASCLKGCMGASFAFVLVCLLVLMAVLRLGCSAVESAKHGFETATRTGTTLHGDTPSATQADRVLEIHISGMIQDDADTPSWFAEPGSSHVALERIRLARDDSSIRGILLHINSGGGGITASDVIWNSLREFRNADTNRVVVAMMGAMAASGAYYIASAADSIIANPTTLTGSIGVILNSYNIEELATKIGLKNVTIKSGGNKDLLSPFKTLSAEQEQMLQRMVDAMHTRFVQIVAEGRGLDQARVRVIADGRILLATEALELDLINRIGYVADAREEMARRLGFQPTYINPDKQPGFLRLLRSPTFWGECFFRAASSARKGLADDAPVSLE